MISERDGAEDVGGQALLSVLLLDSLLPEGWGELEDPIWRPHTQEVKEVAEVRFGSLIGVRSVRVVKVPRCQSGSQQETASTGAEQDDKAAC